MSRKGNVPSITPPVKRLFDITGKTALVTGGAEGIGAMIAATLVEQGVKTYIVSRTPAACQNTARKLTQHGGSCIPLSGDVSTLSGIQDIVQAFGKHEDQLDILVNNAGTSCHAPFETFPEFGWDKVLSLNLKSPFFLSQQLIAHLKRAASKKDPGRIINIASINGMTCPARECYSYSASKAGLIHLSQHLAIQLASENITVNALSPAGFQTKTSPEWPDKLIKAGIPLGRMGTADDIGGAVVYLCSSAGAWLTGVNIPIDGGRVICTTNSN